MLSRDNQTFVHMLGCKAILNSFNGLKSGVCVYFTTVTLNKKLRAKTKVRPNIWKLRNAFLNSLRLKKKKWKLKNIYIKLQCI